MLKTLLAIALTIMTSTAAEAQVAMTIDALRRGPLTSPYQYGLFFEEINHAGDGGLYAELVRNRNFAEGTAGWSAVGGATFQLSSNQTMNEAQAQYLHITTTGASADNLKGVANEGYWGMGVKADSTYNISFFARGAKAFKGKIIARLVAQSGATLAEATANGDIANSKWGKLTATLRATATDGKASLQILTSNAGGLDIDVVSAFPYTWRGRANGLRPDLAELLHACKPAFLRFPGGCYVEGEGNYETNTFRWKTTLGPIENRPGHMNQNWRYWSSDGLGYHEYLQLCEDLGAAPMFVINIGLGHSWSVPKDQIQPFIQDALDAIEYANGDATTEWGAKRAEAGHPEPFNLKFIEIGNENYQAGDTEYADRYIQFYNAIHSRYPELTLIGNVEAWGTDNPTWRNKWPVDLLDEHYYRTLAWMKDNYTKYDSYPRTIGIYNGEYAANQGGYGQYGNVNSALGEAIYALGMERNSDVCRLASFAPIFTHESDPRWAYDMIHFNAAGNFATPSYYVQQLLPNNLGRQNLLWTETGNQTTIDNSNVQVGLGSWLSTVSYDNLTVTDFDGNTIANQTFDGGMQDWTPGIGQWTADGGELTQNSNAENCTAALNIAITGGRYIYKVRAKKNGGGEGFLIMFNRKDQDNYAWWNLGGWGNTKYAVENCVAGSKSTVADKAGSIETGRWYDIEIRVDGASIECKLDGQTIHQFSLPTSRQIYQSVQIDDETGEMIVKIVNPNANATTVQLNVANISMTSATVQRLASANGTDENTMDNPYNVRPTEPESVDPNAPLAIPAFSLNIFRIKTAGAAPYTEPRCEAYEREDEGKAGYLYAHMHTTQEITCFALSHNGDYWHDLFGSAEAFDTKKFTSTGGMRDAFVLRTESGKFMLAGTDMTSRLGWTSNHKMTFMLSNDLVHWDKSISIDLEDADNMAALGLTNTDDMTAAWAPQVIYDPATKKYVAYYSVGFPDRHRIYYSLLNEDLTGFTAPRVLYNPGFDVIDADIVWNDIDKQYTMVFKREGDRALSMATADHLVPTADDGTDACQWQLVDGFGIDEPGQSIEAPSQFRMIGQKRWRLGYEKYSGGYNYRIMDLDEHGHNPANRKDMRGSVAPQHGSFVKLTAREYTYLENWETLVGKLKELRAIYATTGDEISRAAIDKADDALNNGRPTFDENEAAMAEALEAVEKALADSGNIAEALLDNARGGQPTNLTLLIQNADFSKNGNGWTSSPAFTAANGKVAEHFNHSFDFYQTIANLPAGNYELGVQAFYRYGSINNATAAHQDGSESLNAFLYASAGAQTMQPVRSLYDEDAYTLEPYNYPDNVAMANEAFNDKGLYKNTCRFTLANDTDVNIGIRKDESVAADWCCFDNFTLNYLGRTDAIAAVGESRAKAAKRYDLGGREAKANAKGIMVEAGAKKIAR